MKLRFERLRAEFVAQHSEPLSGWASRAGADGSAGARGPALVLKGGLVSDLNSRGHASASHPGRKVHGCVKEQWAWLLLAPPAAHGTAASQSFSLCDALVAFLPLIADALLYSADRSSCNLSWWVKNERALFVFM